MLPSMPQYAMPQRFTARELAIMIRQSVRAGKLDEAKHLFCACMMLMASTFINSILLQLPRCFSTTEGPIRSVDDFTPVEFYEQFRFR